MVEWSEILLPAVFILPPILLIASLFGPWYYYSAETEDQSEKASLDFYFTKYEMEGESSTSIYGSTKDIRQYSDEGFKDNNKFIETMEITRILVILGIVFSILGLIAMALFVFEFIVKTSAFKIALILGILALIFTLSPSIYLMSHLPNAIGEDDLYLNEDQKHDFSGSEEHTGIKESWGGGWGWWTALVAGIITCIGFIIFIIYGIISYLENREFGNETNEMNE